MTGISAERIALIIGRRWTPPSSFTARQPPSTTKRAALRTASSGVVWYVRYGRSPTTSARFAAPDTAFAWATIRSSVAPSVSGAP